MPLPRAVLLILLWPLLTPAATIVVLQGTESNFNRRYFSGFSSLSTVKITAFRYDTTKEVSLFAQIKKVTPDLIFTIGYVPIRRLSDTFSSTPILASQQFGEIVLPKTNVLFLNDEPLVRSTLGLVQRLFPSRKTIGTIYDPKLSQAAFDQMSTEATRIGLKVASLKVNSPQDVGTLINALQGKVDLFFWLRDSTTASAGAISTIFDFADRNNVPVITHDPDQVLRGALLAVAEDPFKLGEQAWNMAKTILDEKKIPAKGLPVQLHGPEIVYVSLKSAARYGITSDPLYAFFQSVLRDNFTVEVRP